MTKFNLWAILFQKKYHYKKCEWAIKTNIHNKVPFNSAKEARDQGYKPCGACLGNRNKR
jgi:hypothetical protein